MRSGSSGWTRPWMRSAKASGWREVKDRKRTLRPWWKEYAERAQRSNDAERRATQAREQLERLHQQEEALRQSVPDFDLARELENPAFLRLTAPHTGLSLEEAYYAAHHRELGQRLAQASLESAVQAVSAGRARPRELRGGQSASIGGNDPRQMTREQREELKKRIYQARAQGKKLPYGS